MIEKFQEPCVSEASGQGQSHEPTVKSAVDTQLSPNKAAKKQRCGDHTRFQHANTCNYMQHFLRSELPDHIVVRVELFLDVLCR